MGWNGGGEQTYDVGASVAEVDAPAGLEEWEEGVVERVAETDEGPDEGDEAGGDFLGVG